RALLEILAADEIEQTLDGLAVHRLHAFAQLEPVVLDGIVAARHLQAPVGAEGDDRVIETGRRHLADQRDVDAGRHQAFGHRLQDARAREAEIAPHRQRLLAAPPEVGAEGLADRTPGFVGEIALRPAANVVFAKDLWVDDVGAHASPRGGDAGQAPRFASGL